MTDKVLCPWCGAEMDTKTVSFKNDAGEYVWSAWTTCRNVECGVEGPYGVYRGAVTEKEAIEAARDAALRRYAPMQKPMKLEELWKEDDPMWVEHKNGALYIGDFYMSMSAKNGWDVQTLGSAKPRLLLEDYYGKTWRCWERKPTDDERSAAEWET